MKTYKLFQVAVLLIFVMSIFNVDAHANMFKPLDGDTLSYKTVKGKVVDSETKEPLAFATVTLVGSNIGTITNVEGQFTLKVPKSGDNEQFEINFLGYKNKLVSIDKLKKKNSYVYLEASSVNITEVKIRPDTPEELIHKVIRQIPNNYAVEPNMMMAFYRETVKQRRRYVSISEAVVEVFKAPYNKIKNDKVKIFKGRKSSDVKKQDTLIFKLQGGPSVALLLDVMKNPSLMLTDSYMEAYNFSIKNIVHIDDKLNYVIEFKQREEIAYPLYQGKLYVNLDNLAITAAEFSLNLDDIEAASAMFIKRKPLGLKLRPVYTNYLVKYKENDGRWYFSYARGEVQFKCKWKRKVFNSNYTVMTEIAVTDRQEDNIKDFTRKEIVKHGDILEDKVRFYTYDNFWGEYNYIEPEQPIENAIRKFERKLKMKYTSKKDE